MATRYAKEVKGVADGTQPPAMSNGAVLGDLRRMRATYDLATDGAVTTADNIVLGRLPAGSVFAFGVLTSSVTLGTSVVAIGTNAAHASNGQFRAAAVSTAVETPALFGQTAAQKADPAVAATPVYLTAATAGLPDAGVLTIDIFYSQVH